jgi:hypothetical protein
MNDQTVEYRLWQAACHDERKAWQFVSGRLPGDPEFDPDAWARWQVALRKANEAMNACLNTPTHTFPKRAGRRHYMSP